MRVVYQAVRVGAQKWHGCHMFEAFHLYGKHSLSLGARYAAVAPETSSWHGTTTRHRSSQQVDTDRNRFTIYHCLIHRVPLSRRTVYNYHVKTAILQPYIHLSTRRNRDRYHHHVLPR